MRQYRETAESLTPPLFLCSFAVGLCHAKLPRRYPPPFLYPLFPASPQHWAFTKHCGGAARRLHAEFPPVSRRVPE
jgi:hypothetical protein